MMIRPLFLAAASVIALAGVASAQQPAGPRAHGPGIQTMLDRLDTNKDGAIDEAEFKAGRTEDFKRLDRDGDGKITKVDFPAAMEQLHSERRAEMEARMFDRLDTNKDGVLTADEFAAAAEKRFARMDSNDDGKLTPDDRPQRKRD